MGCRGCCSRLKDAKGHANPNKELMKKNCMRVLISNIVLILVFFSCICGEFYN